MMPLADDDQMPQQEAMPQSDKKVQDLLMSLARKVSIREMVARQYEIWAATEQHFFYKGQQFGYINRDAGVYQVGQTGGGLVPNQQGSKQPTFTKAFNIYLGYAKSFMAVFCQSEAPTRFEEENPKDSDDIQAAREANKMQRVIDKENPPRMAQKKIAKFLWTDSRCVAWTRYEEDGERFGYDTDPTTGDKIPRGREITDYFGVLETKIPLITGCIADWDYVKICIDRPLSQLKARYDNAKGITSGSNLTGNDQIARMARIGTREGMTQISDDSISYLGVEEHYWFRPSLFFELGDDDRALLEEQYPDGVHLVSVGSVYCQSSPESMDDHIDVMYALEDEGGARISLGSPEVPLQKEFNDCMNLSSEIIKYCIPAGWHDPGAVDTDAFEEQSSAPGGTYPIKKGAKQAGEPIANFFYMEPGGQFPEGLPMYMDNLQGPLSQFLTGQQPALFGGEMSDQKTARGYAMARDQAMGLMALVWMPFKLFRASIMQKAVKLAAKERVKRGSTSLSTFVAIPGKPGQQEPIDVALEDLGAGNALCYPVTDENFPESWTQKSNKFMQLIQFAAQDPLLTQVMTDPNNLKMAKDLLGLKDFVIPGADSDEKQLLEIAEMRKSPPVPDMAAIQQEVMQAAAAGQPPPPLDPTTLPMTSSVPIGKYDDDAAEFKTCTDWINGSEGQQAKRSQEPADKAWYENVELHAGLHKARIDQLAAQAAQTQMMEAMLQKQPKNEPGKNNEGSLKKPQQAPPEGNLPQTSGPAENPSPLM